jgi:diguanylate cyclase (GGDEF)-like protein/PAS domain S-box-containing protein
MTNQACVQTAAREPFGLPHKARSANGAAAVAPRLWQSFEIDSLRRCWRAAASPQTCLPPLEELAFTSPGAVAENVALLQVDAGGELKILIAGKAFEASIGRPARDLNVAELAIDRARALRELHEQAVAQARPVHTVVYGVVDGMVRVYDLVAVALSHRRELSLCMMHIAERERHFSLVEAMFQATKDGLLALAVIRDAAGAPIDFQIAALNDGAALVMQSTTEDLRGRRLSEVCAEIQATEIPPRFVSVFNRGGADQIELEWPRDKQKHIRIGVVTMGDLLAVTLTDISTIKNQEKSFRLLFEANPVPMWVHSPGSLKFLAVNDAAVAHYGYREKAFLAMRLPDIVPHEDRDTLEALIRGTPDAISGTNQLWRNIKADGSEIEVLASWRDVLFREQPAQLVAVVDVTEKRKTEKRISHMARHDALTSLPNRVLFHERLDEALARVRRDKQKVAILYLDLDNFKQVNDALGHPAGDKLLTATAARLCSCVSESDVVARFGGDEFAVLQLAITGPHESSALAERIVKALSEPHDIEGQQVVTGVSIGISIAPFDGETSEQLLKNADIALYRGKDDGRNRFLFFESGMDIRLRSRHALERDLRNALACGEFELFYQPLVVLETGVISGFEALLRWRSPQRGMVSPANFIPLAEETGVIVPLGEWVLRQACSEATKWPENLKVAVNLSPVQFRTGNLPQLVSETLQSTGLAASRLELEVTESILLEESKVNLATLRRLRLLGAGISLDDFGTGYSGLSYLRSFPFDKIKIDRSFVQELGTNGECLAIVQAITRLGLSLGVATIAEGVETDAQRELLCKEGCKEMQGFLFSAPIPSNEIAGFLSRNRNRWPAREHRLAG